MNKQEYLAKYKDPRWQKKRLEIFERDEWTCQACMDCISEESDSKEAYQSFHVHHLYYNWGSAPWEYPNEALVTLCESCHQVETQDLKEAERRLIRALKVAGGTTETFNRLAEGFECIKAGTQTPARPDIATEYIRELLLSRKGLA